MAHTSYTYLLQHKLVQQRIAKSGFSVANCDAIPGKLCPELIALFVLVGMATGNVGLPGAVTDISISADGLLFASAADDKSLKVFDVVNFGK